MQNQCVLKARLPLSCHAGPQLTQRASALSEHSLRQFEKDSFMPTDLPRRANQQGEVIPWLGRTLFGGFLAAVVVTCGALVAYGPQIRAAQEAERAHLIDEEDRAFCARFGAGPQTGRYAECAAALNGIRARHEERILSEVAGIL
jgi:hypothetical protein